MIIKFLMGFSFSKWSVDASAIKDAPEKTKNQY